MIREIPLTKGHVALVDTEDFERANQFKWFAQVTKTNVYAARDVRRKGQPRQYIFLHQFLLGAKGIDHRDGDGLNNRRANLRIATCSQNLRASKKKFSGTSRFRGVRLHRPGRWTAQLKLNGRQIYLGIFDGEIEAAHAYDAAARWFFGEFAAPNFP